jgi:hypothetical protein
MIRKILPRSFKKSVRAFIKKEFHFKDANEHHLDYLVEKKENEGKIPKLDLQKKHIKNLEVILNRTELLTRMPQGKICAEIGVNEGEFSEQILKINQPSKLHLIDAWGNAERYHDGLKLIVEDKFDNEIKKGIVEINVGFSTVVLESMPDNYFDWVYLDTDHSYNVTASELDILKDKVKPGGIIAGHDYIIGNWSGDVRYGVIEAVTEFCVNSNWEMVFLTINKNEMTSFAIKKME